MRVQLWKGWRYFTKWWPAIVVLLASNAQAFTLLGAPGLLSPGQAPNFGFDFLGEQFNPRLDIDGFVRFQTLAYRMDNANNGFLVPEVDLDLNLQLTVTQRIHALFRPLERGDLQPTEYEFGPRNPGWILRDMAVPADLYYEGQPFNWLNPNDRWPLDFTVSGGRIPLTLQNGIWFDNIFDGFMISKNNIQLGNLSNLNLLFFLSVGETQGGLTEAQFQQIRKKLTGVAGDADWYAYFLEFGFACSYDNASYQGQNFNRCFWAVSSTRTFGSAGGLSLRAMGSTGNSSMGSGELVVLETQHRLWGTLAYANFFAATPNWLPPSVQGEALSNEGVLFTFDRLAPFPQLDANGADTIGGALGTIFQPKGIVTYTPEVGFLIDNSAFHNDQAGCALQIQMDLARVLLSAPGLEGVARRGLFYGALARLTLVALRNQNTVVARDRFDFGERLELIYRF
ncbi:MAG TPA: hypothetical protein VKV28_07945 [Candidatus Binataceae bacterium]|nr:hypothetical protein [Candidatus Binataceae bacterium]